MKKFRFDQRGIRKKIRERVMAFVLLSGMVLLLFYGTANLAKIGNRQGIRLTKEAVNRAAIQCYAIEGNYPPTVAYMEENYGLTYDATKYFIFYEVFASNIMPTIEVYERR